MLKIEWRITDGKETEEGFFRLLRKRAGLAPLSYAEELASMCPPERPSSTEDRSPGPAC